LDLAAVSCLISDEIFVVGGQVLGATDDLSSLAGFDQLNQLFKVKFEIAAF
jgi:hypothetical protein